MLSKRGRICVSSNGAKQKRKFIFCSSFLLALSAFYRVSLSFIRFERVGQFLVLTAHRKAGSWWVITGLVKCEWARLGYAEICRLGPRSKSVLFFFHRVLLGRCRPNGQQMLSKGGWSHLHVWCLSTGAKYKKEMAFFFIHCLFLCVPLVFPPPLRKMFPPVGAETAAPTADVSTNGRPGGRQWNTNFCPNRFFFFLSLSLSLPFSLKDKIKLLEFFFFVEKMGGGGEEKSLFKKRKKRFHVKELRPALKMTNIDTASGVPHFLSPYCFFFLLGSNGCYRVALDIARFSWSFQSVRGTDLRTTQWSLGARNCFIQQCRFNDEEVWPETKANDRTVEFTSRFACFYCIQSELCEPMLIKEIVEISFRGAKCKEVLPWKRSWLSPTLIKHWMRGFSNNALFHLEYL